eukprot:60921-Pleurochrysis_carterae.AAC.1
MPLRTDRICCTAVASRARRVPAGDSDGWGEVTQLLRARASHRNLRARVSTRCSEAGAVEHRNWAGGGRIKFGRVTQADNGVGHAAGSCAHKHACLLAHTRTPMHAHAHVHPR